MIAKTTIKVDADKALEEIRQHFIAKGGSMTMYAGVLNGAKRKPDKYIKDAIPIAPYAAEQEYGGEHTPARAPFRKTFGRYAYTWMKGIEELLIKNPTWTTTQILNSMEHRVGSEIQGVIASGDFKPLAPATIEFKKKMGYTYPEMPLQATRSFINAIKTEVRKTEER